MFSQPLAEKSSGEREQWRRGPECLLGGLITKLTAAHPPEDVSVWKWVNEQRLLEFQLCVGRGARHFNIRYFFVEMNIQKLRENSAIAQDHELKLESMFLVSSLMPFPLHATS